MSPIKTTAACSPRSRRPDCPLAELMKLPEQKRDAAAARLLIVMEAAGRIAAFEIDAIRDRLDVVLKPMQGLSGRCPWLCRDHLAGQWTGLAGPGCQGDIAVTVSRSESGKLSSTGHARSRMPSRFCSCCRQSADRGDRLETVPPAAYGCISADPGVRAWADRALWRSWVEEWHASKLAPKGPDRPVIRPGRSNGTNLAERPFTRSGQDVRRDGPTDLKASRPQPREAPMMHTKF